MPEDPWVIPLPPVLKLRIGAALLASAFCFALLRMSGLDALWQRDLGREYLPFLLLINTLSAGWTLLVASQRWHSFWTPFSSLLLGSLSGYGLACVATVLAAAGSVGIVHRLALFFLRPVDGFVEVAFMGGWLPCTLSFFLLYLASLVLRHRAGQ